MLVEPEILQRFCLAGVWIALGIAAYADARTGRVPDKYLLGGLTCALLACLASALQNPHMLPIIQVVIWLMAALSLGLLIWSINEIWYRWRGQDAIGMGDAKWSVVAALAFGLAPVLWAWALAAWLGLAWIGLARWRGVTRPYLHFTPFLGAALLLLELLRQP